MFTPFKIQTEKFAVKSDIKLIYIGGLILGKNSAFRANKTVDQAVSGSTAVTFENTLFDLENEYDGVTTFTAKKGGVYTIIASILFAPTNTVITFTKSLLVNVNGIPVAIDSITSTGNGFISVSTIYKLNKGDTLSITLSPQIDGFIESSGLSFFAAT